MQMFLKETLSKKKPFKVKVEKKILIVSLSNINYCILFGEKGTKRAGVFSSYLKKMLQWRWGGK